MRWTSKQDGTNQFFNATELLAELQDSFSYDIVITERMNDEMKQKLLAQEEIAKELFEKWYNIKTANSHYIGKIFEISITSTS